MSIWTKDFWTSTGERVVRTAAQGALISLGDSAVEALQVNAFALDWAQLGGYAAGGGLLAFLFSLAGNLYSRTGPSFTQAEVAVDNVPAAVVEPHRPEPGA